MAHIETNNSGLTEVHGTSTKLGYDTIRLFINKESDSTCDLETRLVDLSGLETHDGAQAVFEELWHADGTTMKFSSRTLDNIDALESTFKAAGITLPKIVQPNVVRRAYERVRAFGS